MSWTKEDRSFKTLINKETTDSANKFFFNELGASTINIHTSEIWSDNIPFNDPAQAVTDGVAEQKTLFVLTEDLTIPNNQSWKAESPPGTRLADWISDKYGSSYTLHLFDNAGSEIFTTDPVGWFFDYQTGILTFSGNAAGKARPFNITGYRYIGAKGGGGGGTKIYTTEAALLASADSAGTQAYAKDTGNFWFRRAFTWQPIPHFQVVRRVAAPYTLTVDPVAGDDSAWNDGVSTPLKTLEACLQRLPQAIQGQDLVKVLLKAGDHSLPFSPDGYSGLTMDFGKVQFQGETEDVQTFALDHFSNGNVVVWQPAGNPAWVVDEHVGRRIKITITWGLNSYDFHWFIIANGTHDLTVAFGFDPSLYFPVGSDIVIQELKTRWIGPRGVAPTGNADGILGFTDIAFDQSVHTTLYIFDFSNGNLTFQNCLMRQSGVVWNPFVYMETPLARAAFYSCMFLNHFSGIFTYSGQVFMQDVVAVNTTRLVESRMFSNLDIRGSFYTRNCSEIFYSAHPALRALWTYGGILHCLNTPSVWQIGWYGGDDVLYIEGRDFSSPDNKLPGNWVTLTPGNRVKIANWDLEASVPGNSIVCWDPNGDFPTVSMSIADLKTIYGRHYDYGRGCEVIALWF